MREHKLRAWDKNRCAMFQVMEVTFDAQYESGFSKVVPYPYDEWNKSENSEGNWANRPPRDWTYLHEEINNLEIMQYTGLKDKAGKRIYERDIVKDRWGILWKVQWNEEKAEFELDWCGGPQPEYYRVGMYLIRDCQCEVIGNRYETPELIKGEP